MFSYLTSKDGGYMTNGDNGKDKIIDEGHIGTYCEKVNNVLLVDGLKHNILILVNLVE